MAEPEGIARVVLFLTCDALNWITGERNAADGGYLA